MNKLFIIHLFAFIIFAYAKTSLAFPDLVRHGYMNCNSCHTSHVGGDLLTPYGKSTNLELVSTKQSWIYQRPIPNGAEETTNPENTDQLQFQWGLSGRTLQSFLENSQSSKARFMIMQIQGDALLSYQKLYDFYFSLGRTEPNQADSTLKDFIYIPQSWIRINQTIETESQNPILLQIKLGKFTPAYGIRFQEHNFLVRRDLDFNMGKEKLNLEALIQYEEHELVLNQILGATQYAKQNPEVGQILRYSYTFLDENLKMGINLYNTKEKSDPASIGIAKNYLGIFALKGFEEKNYLLAELDQKNNADHTRGYIETLKMGQEIENGLQFFVVQEYENLQIQITDPHIESFGIGLHYFPSPYLNIETLFKKEKNTGVMNEYQNVLWLVGHLFF